MKKTLIAIFAFSLIISSCDEDESPDEVYSATVSGTLYDSCGSPAQQVELIFADAGSAGNIFQPGATSKELTTVTTDDMGRFSITLTERLSGGWGFFKQENHILFYGSIFTNDINETDIGGIYLNSFARPARIKLSKPGDWPAGSSITINQKLQDGTNVSKTVKNESGQKQGLLYTDWAIYFSEKRSYDISKDSMNFVGSISAGSGRNTVTKTFYSQGCDTANMGTLGFHFN